MNVLSLGDADENHAGTSKHQQQNGVEKAGATGNYLLVDQGGKHKHQQLSTTAPNAPAHEALDITVQVVEQPVVHDSVPLAVVGTPRPRVPPIEVESTISKSEGSSQTTSHNQDHNQHLRNIQSDYIPPPLLQVHLRTAVAQPISSTTNAAGRKRP